jgi:mannan endo-1,4-beta-mannosidase
MKKTISVLLVIAAFFIFAACDKDNPTPPTPPEESPKATNDFLVDTLATVETVALFQNLKTVAQTGVLFGHQDDTAYGVGWRAESERSDVKSIVGDYPAVYGWDLGDIGAANNLDGVSFANMKKWIKETYARGGVNTLSMHLDNPVSGGNAWDNSEVVKHIITGGAKNADYLTTLDLIATFILDLKSDTGDFIPIILRPYHEHNHTWSWWGSSACSVDEYNALWKMTVDYFRDVKGVHNVLYAISPQEISSEAQYLERYPGDDYVDILGLDYYALWDKPAVPRLGTALHIIAKMAEARNKVSALTEVGIDKVPIRDWWTNYLLASVNYSAESKKTAWTLVWRNDSESHFFAPYPGQRSEGDFVKFYQNSFTLFENDLPGMYE